MPDPIRCCLLGVCCPPGGKAQRADLKAWLLEKLESMPEHGDPHGVNSHEVMVEGWLDELPWKEE